MRKAGKTQQEIADVLGVSHGTISKELRRNRGPAQSIGRSQRQ
jgi:IS30 family transposase